MNINPKEIRKQFERVISSGWLPWFQEAAKRADTSTAHFLAIGSRETNLRNIKGDFRNGRWNGFGVMQVDVGTDPVYARNWTPQAVEPSIRRGGEIYSEKVDDTINGQGKRLKVRKYTFTGRKVEPDDVRRIATAGYNCGRWSYYHFSRGEHVDSTTTGHDYSRDVYDRSIEFAALLQEKGIEPNALKREVALQGKYATKAAQKRAGVSGDEVKENDHLEMAEPLEDQSGLIRVDARNHPEDVEDPDVDDTEKTVDAKKGVTTGTTASLPTDTEGTPPPAPAAEIKASRPSLKSTAAAVVAFLMAPLSYLGIDLKQIGDFAKSNIALAIKLAFVFGLIVLAYHIWNRAMDRANQRTLKLMDAGAEKEKNNLRLV